MSSKTDVKRQHTKEQKEVETEEQEEQRRAAVQKTDLAKVPVVIGDFRDHAGEVEDESLSLVFTDPPYNRKASKVLPELGSFCERKLTHGGSLICYVGQTQLPAALDALREHLRYWWTVNCSFSEGHTLMKEYGIKARWKPVLWFVKGTRGDKQTIVEDVMSGGREKTDHEWQQAMSEAEYWIRNLCPEDGLVCDPYLGSGTTALAAHNTGRKWIGFERDTDTAEDTIRRIEDHIS